MLKRRLVLSAALASAGLLAIAVPAGAKSSGHLKAVETVNISAPPAKVWAIIQNFSDLTWHPAIKKSEATTGNTVGSIRTLDLGGPKLTEELTKYNASKMTYSYKFTDDPNNIKVIPAANYHSTITVKPGPNHGSTVVWRGSFTRADPSPTPAAGMDDAAAVKAITGVYRGGLDNLKKLAEAAKS